MSDFAPLHESGRSNALRLVVAACVIVGLHVGGVALALLH